MFKLRTGYFISGIATGLVLLFSFISSLPDGRLHIYVCNVGQGDAVYVCFPDGRDMVVDGGPSDAIIACLGKYMPFWDRHIDMVVMTHPQKDHMQGLISVFERYRVDYFIRSDIDNTTDGYKRLIEVAQRKHVSTRFVSAGERITVGSATLTFLWPSSDQIAKGKRAVASGTRDASRVLGAAVGDLNDYSLVFWLRFGSFDAFFTGDADTRVETEYTGNALADETVELLKVPHHGSRTGMNEAFVNWLRPKFAVISVGKNNYGHPSGEALRLLESVGSVIHRTDKEGDIEVVSDGVHWDIL